MDNRVFLRSGFEALAGDNAEGQRRCDRQDEQVDQGLAARGQAAAQNVGVSVSEQKKQLKKQHAGSPNLRRAAKPGDQKPAQQRLNLKQQKCAEKNSAAEQNPPNDRIAAIFFHAADYIGIQQEGQSGLSSFSACTKKGKTVAYNCFFFFTETGISNLLKDKKVKD